MGMAIGPAWYWIEAISIPLKIMSLKKQFVTYNGRP